MVKDLERRGLTALGIARDMAEDRISWISAKRRPQKRIEKICSKKAGIIKQTTWILMNRS